MRRLLPVYELPASVNIIILRYCQEHSDWLAQCFCHWPSHCPFTGNKGALHLVQVLFTAQGERCEPAGDSLLEQLVGIQSYAQAVEEGGGAVALTIPYTIKEANHARSIVFNKLGLCIGHPFFSLAIFL